LAKLLFDPLPKNRVVGKARTETPDTVHLLTRYSKTDMLDGLVAVGVELLNLKRNWTLYCSLGDKHYLVALSDMPANSKSPDAEAETKSG
jgi:hypothetical protein